LAEELRVPLVLIVRLKDAIAWWKITDRAGTYVTKFDIRETLTQQTCNGGEINRINAYVHLDTMQMIPIK